MLLMCLQIFFARVVDVTFGTLRTIFIVRGKKYYASFIAFFEVLIWFLIAKEALDNINESILVPICYSGGFAVGTYIGINITNKYINSYVNVNIVTKIDNKKMINILREKGYAVSIIGLKEAKDFIKKDLLIITINRNYMSEVTNLVKSIDSNAFINFNDTKYVQNGLIK